MEPKLNWIQNPKLNWSEFNFLHITQIELNPNTLNIIQWKNSNSIELVGALVIPMDVTTKKWKKRPSCACMMTPNAWSSLYVIFSLLFHFCITILICFNLSWKYVIIVYHWNVVQFSYGIVHFKSYWTTQVSIPCDHIKFLL